MLMARAVRFIFLGRDNPKKRFSAFHEIAHSLSAEGYVVEFFESVRAQANIDLDRQLDVLWPGLSAKIGSEHPAHLRIIRLCVKSLLMLLSPKRMLLLRGVLLKDPFRLALELEQRVNLVPERVVLIGHSAGGIAAARASDHSKITGIVCIGYPFRHPDRPPEPYRTKVLTKVSKPMLIVQGSRDEYGSDPALFGPFLPPDCQVLTVPCGHDYNDLSDADLDKVLASLRFMAGR